MSKFGKVIFSQCSYPSNIGKAHYLHIKPFLTSHFPTPPHTDLSCSYSCCHLQLLCSGRSL